MSGIGEWARQWLLLQRRCPYQSDGNHELWMRCGGSAGHAGLYAVDIRDPQFRAVSNLTECQATGAEKRVADELRHDGRCVPRNKGD